LQISYDQEADALYITLREARWSYTRALGPLRNVDYSADGVPIGVELLCASRGIDLRDVPEADAIGEALRDSFRVYA